MSLPPRRSTALSSRGVALSSRRVSQAVLAGALSLVVASGLVLPAQGAAVPAPRTGGTHAAASHTLEPHAHGSMAPDYVVDPAVRPLARGAGAGASGSVQLGDGTWLASGDHTDRTVTGVSTYDVHVLAATTPAGGHGTTKARARTVIERLDAEYARETGGLYRFRLASYKTVQVDVSSCSLEYWRTKVGALPKPTSGATDATWVAVGQAPCGYSGLAYLDGAGVHILPEHFRAAGALSDPGEAVGQSEHHELDVAILAHEIGHNLGLWHAQAQAPHTGTPFPGTPVEYGSHFSTMGANQSAVRFSASELIDLGAMNAARTEFALKKSQTWTLAPMSGTSGTQAVVVPLGDTHHTVLSYRNGSGQDWPLKYGVPANRDGSAASNVGVHVESSPEAPDLRDVAVHDDANRTITARPAGQGTRYAERQAYTPGEKVVLTGGVTVEVLSMDDKGARVRVTRPDDVSAPVFNPYDTTSICDNVTPTGPRTSAVKRTSQAACWAYGAGARASYELRPAMDDTWVARTGIDVNGKSVVKRSWTLERRRSGQGATSFAGSRFSGSFTLPRGTHEVELWAEDVFGKRTSHRSTFTLKRDMRSSAVRSLKASKVKWRSLTLSWKKPATPRSKITDYVVKVQRLKGGKWTKAKTYKDGVSTKTSVRVTGLVRGGTYRFTVKAKNKHGSSPSKKLTVRTAR